MPHATLDGIRARDESCGSGDPVLMLSSLGGPAVGWLLPVRDLAPRYRVITLDNRGAGETDMQEVTRP